MLDTLAAAVAALLLGLSRGTTICLLLCVPGMLSLLLTEKASVARSLWLGFLLSLPRILLLTLLGAALGALSFSIVSSGAVRGLITAISVGSYILLGMLLVTMGVRLLHRYETDEKNNNTLKAATKHGEKSRNAKKNRKRKNTGNADDPACHRGRNAPGTFWQRILMRFYPRLELGRGRSEIIYLLWGGLLSLACVGELSLVEATAVSAVAGTGAPDLALSAGIGGMLMFFFALGASIPVMVAAAASGGLAKNIRDNRTLLQLRGVSAVLMMLLGFYFVGRQVYYILTVAKIMG